MAGLGRVQQRFNAAVVAALTLLSFGPRGQKAAEKDYAVAQGMPLAKKYLRPANPAAVRSRYAPHTGARQRARVYGAAHGRTLMSVDVKTRPETADVLSINPTHFQREGWKSKLFRNLYGGK